MKMAYARPRASVTVDGRTLAPSEYKVTRRYLWWGRKRVVFNVPPPAGTTVSISVLL